MRFWLSAVICGALLAGCADEATVAKAEQWAERPSLAALNAEPTLSVMSAWGVALNIASRCDSLKVDKRTFEYMKPILNRVVFLSKAKTSADFERAKKAFQRKHGKPLISETSHCDAGYRELKEQTPMSAFLQPT